MRFLGFLHVKSNKWGKMTLLTKPSSGTREILLLPLMQSHLCDPKQVISLWSLIFPICKLMISTLNQ